MTAIEESVSAAIAALPSMDSRRAYASDWARFLGWLEAAGVTVLDARPRHVAAHLLALRDEGKARASIARAATALRSVFSALVRDELIASNPAREVKTPRMAAEPRTPWLDEAQVAKLFALPADTWTERRDRACLCLLLGLGWRRREVAALCVEDFRDGVASGRVKGDKTLRVGAPAWLAVELDAWRAFAGIDQGALLPRSPTNPAAISGSGVYRAVVRVARAAGLSASPHSLRRAVVTILGERGVSLKARQLAVGHASSSTTERYDHARDASRQAPAQLLADLVVAAK